MEITNAWSKVSSSAVLIQNTDAKPVSMCYASTTPTTELTFALLTGQKRNFPKVLGKSLYARTLKPTANLTVEEVSDASSEANRYYSGRCYTLRADFTLIEDGTAEIVIETSSEIVTIDSISLGSASIETVVGLYEDATYTSSTGAALAHLNRNRNFKGDVLPATSELDPTILTPGSLLIECAIYGTSGTGSNKDAFSTNGAVRPTILEPNSIYRVEIANFDTSTRPFRFTMHMSH